MGTGACLVAGHDPILLAKQIGNGGAGGFGIPVGSGGAGGSRGVLFGTPGANGADG
ncbi:Uncharacterised protein [Mycobacterium tuberculosis]|nr:Uncharacterised protein [Mycobacterium tuberculosis]